MADSTLVFATIKNLSLGYPARRVTVNPQTVKFFASVDEAKEFLAEHSKIEDPWEYEYTYGVEHLFVP